MTAQVPDLPILAWDQAYNRNGDPKLPRAVANVIRTYMNNHSLTGYVKAETLAKHTGLQVRGVRKQIAANVAAGWLEIVESGHSGRKANVYRLTYPKGVPQDTVASGVVAKGVPEDTEGCPTGPVKGVPQDTPTTLELLRGIFSRSSEEGTTPGNGVLQDTLPTTDPEGSGGSYLPVNQTTGQSNGVLQDTLSDDWTGLGSPDMDTPDIFAGAPPVEPERFGRFDPFAVAPTD